MPNPADIPAPADPAVAAVKAISDLDVVVRSVRSSLALSKPWQRQLRAKLDEAARHLDILRLTISLERRDAEIVDAAGALLTVLRQAHNYIDSGRADEGTRSVVRLAFELAQKMDRSIAAHQAASASCWGQG